MKEQTTIDQLAHKIGLAELCKMFKWQGGTIHQAKEELRIRLKNMGYVEDKNGIICELKIGGLK